MQYQSIKASFEVTFTCSAKGPVLGAVALCTALGFGSAASAENVRVGMAVSWPTYSFLELAEERGVLGDLEVETVIIEDFVRAHTMLATGQIDVLFALSDYAALNAAAGLPTSIVAGLGSSYGVDQIVAQQGASADSIRGTTIAAPEGNPGQLLMLNWLRSLGLGPNDVRWTNLPADQTAGPIASGDVSAAFVYEPWTSRVIEANPEYEVVLASDAPEVFGQALLNDVVFMNNRFVEERRETATAVLEGVFRGIGIWNEDPITANATIAGIISWPAEDVGYVLGENGKFLQGGVYVFDFDESARQCGALEGESALGQPNGTLLPSIVNAEAGYRELGIITTEVDAAAIETQVDCSLLGDILAGGFRQSLAPQSPN